MKKFLAILLTACISLTAFAGCAEQKTEGSNEKEANSSATTTAQEEKDEKVEAEKTGVTIPYPSNMQEKGYAESLSLNEEPKRVVVMSKAPVLVLHELGVKMIAVPESGVISWPEDLASTEKLNVSMNSNFDIETVIALEPDLVIMGYTSQETYGKSLDDANIPVYYVDAGHTVPYESVKAQTQALVDAFAKDKESADSIMGRFTKLEERLDGLRADYQGKSVMVLQSSPPNHYIQTEKGTLASMAAMMGFDNVYKNDESSMVQLDLESALSYNPDLVLCVGGSKKAEEHQKLMEEDFAKNPAYWNSIPAIANGNILYFPADYIASTGIGVIDNMNNFIDTIQAHNLEK